MQHFPLSSLFSFHIFPFIYLSHFTLCLASPFSVPFPSSPSASFQINLLHRSRVEFPAVTVCNQNRVNCLKLFAKMLKKASVSTEDDDFKRLVSMYNITHCGVDSLGCPRVRDLYHQFYMESPKGIPAVFRERDACLTCSEILLEYSGECQNSKSHAPKEYLNFLWQEGDCDSIVASPSFDWSPFPDAEQLRYYVMQESLERCPCPGNCHSFDEPLFADGSQLPESSNLSTVIILLL